MKSITGWIGKRDAATVEKPVVVDYPLGSSFPSDSIFRSSTPTLSEPSQPAAIAVEPESSETHPMNWLKLFSLIPYIAAGVQVVHADLDGPGKVQAAQDALAIATAAAGTVLSTADSAKATAISSLASTTLAGLVTALHEQGAA